MVRLRGLAAVCCQPRVKTATTLIPFAVQVLFRRAQLKALVDVHGQTEGLGGNLSADEVTVIRGALDLTHKTALNCMTPLDKVCTYIHAPPLVFCPPNLHAAPVSPRFPHYCKSLDHLDCDDSS